MTSAGPGARIVLVVLALTGVACAEPDYDLLIRGGTVVDGTGAPPILADVAVQDGVIVRVGPMDGSARHVVDATGLVVAPGFVDIHSHADLILLAERQTQERLLGAKIAQGVTTIIVGNCGLGTAPVTPEAAEVLSDVNGWMTPEGVEAGAITTGGFLDRLAAGGIVLNVGTLVPHGPVRVSAMGLAPGEPSAEQLGAMIAMVERGLDDGAFGLSTGLIYPPGMYSATAELVELARIVAERDALFTSHVRGSSETLIEATGELIEIARRSGARVHHSHLEAVGEPFWPYMAKVLRLEDAARREGLAVSHDVFPYTRAATMMSAIFPPWALEGGIRALLERLGNPPTRRRLETEIEERSPEWPPWQPGGWPHNLVGAVGWDGILIASIPGDDPAAVVGRSLADIAATEGRSPFEVIADLMISEEGRIGQFVDEISGRDERIELLLAILSHPAAAVVSDAEDYGRGRPHPAHAGAFARALRLNREHGLLSLQALVRRMTSYPASLLGIEDRGVVRQGARADLVVFDAARVTDRASWEQPRLRADGVHTVVINGRVAVAEGRYLGGLYGAILRRD